MKDIIIEKKKEKAILKFEDLFQARKEIYANGSTDSIKNTDRINELADTLHPEKIEVVVASIIQENDKTKSFILKKINGSFPPFKAGSYITLELTIDQRIYKMPFPITSNPNKLEEYKITISESASELVSNYMYHNCQEGQTLCISSPYENFSYNRIRDSKDVILICSGFGITSLYALVQELLSQQLPSITLLYEETSKEDLLWTEELEKLEEKNKNFNIKYFLQEEKINKEAIENVGPTGKSLFITGNQSFYERLNPILKELEIPNKFIRHDMYTTRLKDFFRTEHKLTVITKNKSVEISCYENETLLQSLEKAQITIPSQCTVGVCGFCRSKLISGEVKTEISGLRKKDIELKYIHPCVSYPLSDITLQLPN